MNFLSLFYTMIELFSFIMVGFLLSKLKRIDKINNQVLSRLVAEVLTPALILSSVFTKNSINADIVVKESLVAGMILYGLYLIIFYIVKLLPLKKSTCDIYKMSIMFTNTSFIGYPILRIIYGDFSVFIFSLMHLLFNLLLFSVGTITMSKQSRLSLKSIITPGFISSILALICYIMHISCNDYVLDFLTTLGNASVPLSMIVIGVSLSFVDIRKAIKRIDIYLFCIIKLCILPLLFILIGRLLPFDVFIQNLFIFSTMLPTGSMVVILANQYEYESEFASLIVFITTLCSVITIPLLLSWVL